MNLTAILNHDGYHPGSHDYVLRDKHEYRDLVLCGSTLEALFNIEYTVKKVEVRLVSRNVMGWLRTLGKERTVVSFFNRRSNVCVKGARPFLLARTSRYLTRQGVEVDCKYYLTVRAR